MRTPAHTSLFVFGQSMNASPKGEGGVFSFCEEARGSAFGNMSRRAPWALFNQERTHFLDSDKPTPRHHVWN